MIAPRYVGPSTTAVSPWSRNDFDTSSSASMPPLVTSSSSSAGRAPCSASMRAAIASRAGEPARRRVLECGGVARARELLQDRRRPLGRERRRVGKAAGERDQIGVPEVAEDDRDAVARVVARARREELLPLPRLGCDGHGRTIPGRGTELGERDGTPSPVCLIWGDALGINPTHSTRRRGALANRRRRGWSEVRETGPGAGLTPSRPRAAGRRGSPCRPRGGSRRPWCHRSA